jgi:hypothetical protein
LIEAAWNGGVAQHNFHVFAVYPWIGLLRAGHSSVPLHILDQCRVRWGRVESLSGDLVTVTSRELELVGSQLLLGDQRVEVVRRGVEGLGFVDHLAVAATRDNLWAVNSLSARPPAAALESA